MRRPWIALATVLAACGGSVVGSGDPVSTPIPTPAPTVPGVGSLPDTIPATTPPASEPLVVIERPRTAEGEVAELIGDQVAGNRLLMIGDSIFAGAESRYGGELCAGLEPLGWAVEVAAEAGRFVEFGVQVVRREVPESPTDAAEVDDEDSSATSGTSTTTSSEPVPAGDDDWDAAAVFLGSNYNGNKANYDAKMRTILDRLAPRPTLLYTVTEYRTNYADVTDVIEDLVKDYPNVTLIDWASAAKTPGVLRPDGLHPNDAGEQVLVELTAAALGEAPAGEADCIRSRYRDDSAIKAGNGSPNTGGSTSGGSSSTSGSSSSTSGSGSSTSGSSGSTSTTSGSSSTTTVKTTTGGTTTGGKTTTTTVGTTTGGTSGGGTTPTTLGTTTGGTSGGGTSPTTVGTTTGGTSGGGTSPTTVGTTTGGSTTGGSTTGGTTSGGTVAPTVPPATAPPTVAPPPTAAP